MIQFSNFPKSWKNVKITGEMKSKQQVCKQILNVDCFFARDHDKKEKFHSPSVTERSAPESLSSDQRPEGMLEDSVPDKRLFENPMSHQKFHASRRKLLNLIVGSRKCRRVFFWQSKQPMHAMHLQFPEVTSYEPSGSNFWKTTIIIDFQTNFPSGKQTRSHALCHKEILGTSIKMTGPLPRHFRNSGYRPEVCFKLLRKITVPNMCCQSATKNMPDQPLWKTMLDF